MRYNFEMDFEEVIKFFGCIESVESFFDCQFITDFDVFEDELTEEQYSTTGWGFTDKVVKKKNKLMSGPFIYKFSYDPECCRYSKSYRSCCLSKTRMIKLK